MQPLGRRLSASGAPPSSSDTVLARSTQRSSPAAAFPGQRRSSASHLSGPLDAVRSSPGAGELPGAREVVRRIASRWPCALVTGSTRPEAKLMLDALGVNDCFVATLCAGEYPHSGKPSPSRPASRRDASGASEALCSLSEHSRAALPQPAAPACTVSASVSATASVRSVSLAESSRRCSMSRRCSARPNYSYLPSPPASASGIRRALVARDDTRTEIVPDAGTR